MSKSRRLSSSGVFRAVALTLVVTALSPLAATSSNGAPAAEGDANELWTPITTAVRSSGDDARRVSPRQYAAYRLDLPQLTSDLRRAPSEDSAAAPILVELPSPTGELLEFAVKESPVLEDGLAAARPDIATYAGRSTDPNSAASIRLDTTPVGFHASVRGSGESWFVDPAFVGLDRGDMPYLSYLGSDLPEPEQGLIEPEPVVDESDPDDGGVARDQRVGEGANQPVLTRTYRLALLTDPSYSDYFAPDATTAAQYNTIVTAEKAVLMNRVNQIYGDDVSLRMLLIDNTDATNLNTASDAFQAGGPCGAVACFTSGLVDAGCSSDLLDRTTLVLGQIAGAENFDIGHIALGLNGGGIAGLGVVGLARKAEGCTGLPEPTGDFFAVDYVAHEMGHQFDGPHTFNGTDGSCSGLNRSADASVEPGSGSSVMAYAGICGTDDLQPHTDPYFSQQTQGRFNAFVRGTRANLSEIETVKLVDFGGTDAFTLTFPGRGTTAPITRGTNYSTGGIKAAVEAVTGGTVTVAGFFGGAFNDSGFRLTFSGALAGTAIVNPAVNVSAGAFTAQANDIRHGGPPTNGGISQAVSANRVPAVTAPADRTIPIRTPFELTGSATDLDGDVPLFLWEQNDIGIGAGTDLTNVNRTSGPLFRVFGQYADVSPAGTLTYESPGENLATTNPTRTFPDIQQILDGNTNAVTGTCATVGADRATDPGLQCLSELLPTATYLNGLSRQLNFRLTARDLGGADGGFDGGTSFDDTVLTLNPLAGPFLVSSQATNQTVAGRDAGTVTWEVAGTNIATMAPNVKISLSTDGGLTYPQVLLASTPNDGTETVTWPNIATTTARIKVEAVDNYFFDINDSNFTITRVAEPPTPTPTPTTPPAASETTPPQTVITTGPKNNRFVLSNRIKFEYGADEDGVTYTCRLAGVATFCPAAGELSVRNLPPGATYTFSIAATDAAGNTDATAATRTFVTPFNDRQLRVEKRGWVKKRSKFSYRGSYRSTRTKGATLKLKVKDAKKLSLILTRVRRGGSVDVFIGGKKLRTVKLTGKSTRQRRLISIKSFAKPRSGVVRIKTRNNRQVRIEGLGVRTRT